MKILILGSGQVGSTVAQNLAQQPNNDVTVVDIDEHALKVLGAKLDIQTVLGNAASPTVLQRAGADDTDLILALTRNDEVNLVACKVAAEIFRIPTRIARVRSSDYTEYLWHQDADALPDANGPSAILSLFGVQEAIRPEQLVTEQLYQLLHYPGALQVLNFAGGQVQMAVVRTSRGGLLVGKAIANINHDLPEGVDCQICAVYRNDQLIIPSAQTVLIEGDEVFCIAAQQHMPLIIRELRPVAQPIKRVMLAGGGNIGFRLAQKLEQTFDVKIIEFNQRRAEWLSEQLDHSLVLLGSATDEALLAQENIDDIDVFCALTNDDEDNIMSSLLAKNRGVKRVITLVNRSSYVNLLQGPTIDIVLSPHLITIGSILAHIRRGDVVAVHALRHGEAEAVEVIIHGDAHTSPLVGRSMAQIELPKGCHFAALVRADEVIMAHKDVVLSEGDHVIVFVSRREAVRELEKLIQVRMGFF